IQAMDLLGRKLGMNQGKPIMDLMGEIQGTIAAAKANPRVEEYAGKIEAALNKLGEVALHLGKTAMSPQVLAAFAHAYSFMEVAGDVLMSWQLLWRATLAAEKLDNGAKKKDAAFYEGQLKSVEFFANSVLPVTLGKMNAILIANSAVVDISEDSFGGK
ncbi:MAG: acyl-CoA dehydrogenase C-terminal domain-containing protein, partial [Deltaproteobacteria bacterium]|nr:acyl-CoA dehydrogenase C-terminal domain-containing protein [Deltaproteobacteria bacterium]